MPITTQRTALMAHVFFVPEGTSYTIPSSNTAGILTKPGGSDTSWLNGYFGPDVEEFEIAGESEPYEFMGGQPGGLVVTDIVELSRKMKITFGSQQYDARLVQLLFGTLALTSASSQANPLEGNLIVKGWLKFQAYDSAGVIRMTGDKWGALKMTKCEPWSGRNVVKAKFELAGIRSTLDTLSFA